jgi:tRNA threonylcarbamoyladenosine biosynthesis protein TsaB
MKAPLTLALDASTYVGTVAVLRGSDVVSEGEAEMRGEREERLMPAVADVLALARAVGADLDRVVCGGGPGSFTSLRIAASIAKGIALVHDIPLVAVSSLALIVAAQRRSAGRYLAVLDAMRGDVYASLVEVGVDGEVISVAPAILVPAANVDLLAASEQALVIGASRHTEGAPHARGVARMAAILDDGRVSLQHWEPAYGRLAEAQVKWEAAHGRELPAS